MLKLSIKIIDIADAILEKIKKILGIRPGEKLTN